MNILSDEVIAARAGWSREIKRGQVLRLVDLEGKQAVDFLCYNARDHADRYAAADTMKINPAASSSQRHRALLRGLTPLFTMVADTCGSHDTIGGCCSLGAQPLPLWRGHQPELPRQLPARAREIRHGPQDMVANVNFFMYVPVGAGRRDGHGAEHLQARRLCRAARRDATCSP